MNLRTPIAITLTFAIVVLVPTLLVSESKSQNEKSFTQTEIPVVVTPLKDGDEVVAVDIQCEPVLIEKPDTLENYACYFVNRTNKSIRAFGIMHSVVFDTHGTPGRTSRLNVADTYIHPDMLDMKKAVAPGDKSFIGPPGPIIQRGSVFTALELAALYIEFSDGTTVGTHSESVELITAMREGAARFKDTVRQEYLNKGRSVNAILPRLQEKFTGDDQQSWNVFKRTGANGYRRFLQTKYDKDGSAALSKILLTAYELKDGIVIPLDTPGGETSPFLEFSGKKWQLLFEKLKEKLRGSNSSALQTSKKEI